jgi:hypothetical protein
MPKMPLQIMSKIVCSVMSSCAPVKMHATGRQLAACRSAGCPKGAKAGGKLQGIVPVGESEGEGVPRHRCTPHGQGHTGWGRRATARRKFLAQI